MGFKAGVIFRWRKFLSMYNMKKNYPGYFFLNKKSNYSKAGGGGGIILRRNMTTGHYSTGWSLFFFEPAHTRTHTDKLTFETTKHKITDLHW